MENRKNKYMIVGFTLLLMGLVSITYGFFNYTRTGNINNLGTGRIFFSTDQSDTLNLTNLFPMTSTEAANANLDSFTLEIEGDTTYADGEEYEITFVDVVNTINGKEIPINFIATYTANAGETVGTDDEDEYWDDREDKDTFIYTLKGAGTVKEGERVLAGYIKEDEDGIRGVLTIKAYIDADRIVISDTYPEKDYFIVNSNMTADELDDCEDFFASYTFDSGSTATTFCQGTGTIDGKTFQEMLNDDEFNVVDKGELLGINAIIIDYTNETGDGWVNGRTVFTTAEWNSLSSNPISFKIRAESNEGVWIENPFTPLTMDEMCPDCVFTYSTTAYWATWNDANETPTVLTSSDYYEDYEDIGIDYFLGLKLNGSNEIEKAYACGLYNGTTPFCIEGYYDDSKYEINQDILQRGFLWNGACYFVGNNALDCDSPSAGLVASTTLSNGAVWSAVSPGLSCSVSEHGQILCDESGPG